MDGTFKRSPSKFRQILTIHSFNEKLNTTIPLVYIILSHKTESIYTTAFSGLNDILSNNNITVYIKRIQTDFEHHLSGSFKRIFGNKIQVLGCFFHYIKCIWDNIKNKGIKKKIYKHHNKIIIGVLKYIIFIEDQIERQEYFSMFVEIYTEYAINVDVDVDVSDRTRYASFFEY